MILRISVLVAAVAMGLAAAASAEPYDKCGTYAHGLDGCVLFQPDDASGNVLAGAVPSPFQIGDHVRLRGDRQGCVSFCFVDCVQSPVVTVCGPTCAADFDGNGTLNTADLFAFLAAWFAGNLSADFDHSGALAVTDIFGFIGAWFDGC